MVFVAVLMACTVLVPRVAFNTYTYNWLGNTNVLPLVVDAVVVTLVINDMVDAFSTTTLLLAVFPE